MGVRRLVSVRLGVAVAVASLVAGLATAPSAPATTTRAHSPAGPTVGPPKAQEVRDPERWAETTSMGGWSPTADVATLKFQATQGLRIIDLEVVSATPLRLAAAQVFNSGTMARTWWFYVNQSADGVKKKIDKHDGRLIDLERYVVNGKTRFAIVLVRNKGKAAKTWWWQLSRSAGWLKDYAKEKKARIVDLDPRKTSSGLRSDAILIRNKGVDASMWWFYPSLTAKGVGKRLGKHKARLTDLERVGAGRWSAVMERNQGQTWWWWYDRTPQDVAELLDQYGTRPYRIEPYSTASGLRYAVVMMSNVAPETARVRGVALANLPGGRFGFYLKRVGSGPVAALHHGAVFEPASAIKVVHHLHQLRRVANGADALSDDDFTWYHYPSAAGGDSKEVCPNAFDEAVGGNAEIDPVGLGLQEMMQRSDNRTTRGFQLRYGNAALNATADLAGMGGTELRQVLGCGFRDGLRNDLTLVDIGRLYEGVVDGSLLSDAHAARAAFWRLMNGGPIDPSSLVADVARQEGASLGLSPSTVAAFIARVQIWSKGGSYDVCWPGASACSPPYQYIRSIAGRLSLPVPAAAGAVGSREYVFGRFVERLSLDCAFRQPSQTGPAYGFQCPDWSKANGALALIDSELFRSELRSALKTWQ